MGQQTERKADGEAVTNIGGKGGRPTLYMDHELYLDADLNPTTKERAVYVHWWKADGSSGWGTLSLRDR